MKLNEAKFIVIEGLDNSGKSSIAKALAEELKSLGQEVVVYGNPGGDEIGQMIRQVVKSNYPHSANVDAMLLFANRIHLSELIREDLKAGRTVIVDRWDMSAHVYQSQTEAAALKDRVYFMALPLHQKMFGYPNPDVLIYLNASKDVTKQRIAHKDNTGDRYEADSQDKFDAWYDKYYNAYIGQLSYYIGSIDWAKYAVQLDVNKNHELALKPVLYAGQFHEIAGYQPYRTVMNFPITDVAVSAEDNAKEIIRLIQTDETYLITDDELRTRHMAHYQQKAAALAEADQLSADMIEHYKEVGILPKDYQYEKKANGEKASPES